MLGPIYGICLNNLLIIKEMRLCLTKVFMQYGM